MKIYEKENANSVIKQGDNAFRLLVKTIYSEDKLQENLFRELICNSFDANATEVNVKMTMAEQENSSGYTRKFTFIDNGESMSKDFVMNQYSSFLDSTKDSETKIGRFGIGGKIVFALTNKYSIICVHKGMQNIYEFQLNDEGIPVISSISETKTSAPSGTTIEFNVPDDFYYRQLNELGIRKMVVQLVMQMTKSKCQLLTFKTPTESYNFTRPEFYGSLDASMFNLDPEKVKLDVYKVGPNLRHRTDIYFDNSIFPEGVSVYKSIDPFFCYADNQVTSINMSEFSTIRKLILQQLRQNVRDHQSLTCILTYISDGDKISISADRESISFPEEAKVSFKEMKIKYNSLPIFKGITFEDTIFKHWHYGEKVFSQLFEKGYLGNSPIAPTTDYKRLIFDLFKFSFILNKDKFDGVKEKLLPFIDYLKKCAVSNDDVICINSDGIQVVIIGDSTDFNRVVSNKRVLPSLKKLEDCERFNLKEGINFIVYRDSCNFSSVLRLINAQTLPDSNAYNLLFDKKLMTFLGYEFNPFIKKRVKPLSQEGHRLLTINLEAEYTIDAQYSTRNDPFVPDIVLSRSGKDVNAFKSTLKHYLVDNNLKAAKRVAVKVKPGKESIKFYDLDPELQQNIIKSIVGDPPLKYSYFATNIFSFLRVTAEILKDSIAEEELNLNESGKKMLDLINRYREHGIKEDIKQARVFVRNAPKNCANGLHSRGCVIKSELLSYTDTVAYEYNRLHNKNIDNAKRDIPQQLPESIKQIVIDALYHSHNAEVVKNRSLTIFYWGWVLDTAMETIAQRTENEITFEVLEDAINEQSNQAV